MAFPLVLVIMAAVFLLQLVFCFRRQREKRSLCWRWEYALWSAGEYISCSWIRICLERHPLRRMFSAL